MQDLIIVLLALILFLVFQSGGTSKAVMVWFHGGGFSFGSGSTTVYGPQFLMDKNVVLVTVNYRLGPFGKYIEALSLDMYLTRILQFESYN